MLNTPSKVKSLKITSFFLFLIPALGLILSIIFHNFLVSYHFKGDFLLDKFPTSIKCSKENDYCFDVVIKRSLNIKNCDRVKKEKHYLINNKKISVEDYKLKYFNNRDLLEESNVIFKVVKTNIIDERCILNRPFFNKITNIFPNILVFTKNIQQKYQPGSSFSINPFLYGETSISNVVKRYPINFIFKPLIYITSILMMLYWINFNLIFTKIINKKKINKFTIFGILSSIFLFLHVYYLGIEIENQFFQKLKKYFLLLFILFEVTAQYFLTKRLYLLLDRLDRYVHKIIVKLKIIFVIIIIFLSVILSFLLIIYDLNKKVHYIFEWNYFLLLLFFYLLSFLMWKRLIIYPATTQNFKS
jgi:hypothetical protein